VVLRQNGGGWGSALVGPALTWSLGCEESHRSRGRSAAGLGRAELGGLKPGGCLACALLVAAAAAAGLGGCAAPRQQLCLLGPLAVARKRLNASRAPSLSCCKPAILLRATEAGERVAHRALSSVPT